ncbi:NADAR family protein [Simkania sp.]|uniref:NADAR family protein n=1 Tax=Simkania sp. TaxID=34094 RepID=UPI003B516F2C
MLQKIFPAPLRDAYHAYQQNGLSDPEFQKVAMRLGLVASQWFIANQTGLSHPILALSGSILSVPSAAIGAGSYLLYSAMTNLFSETVLSVGYAAAGWALIEYSDRFPMGLLETFFTQTETPEEIPEETPKYDYLKVDFSSAERGVFGAKTIVDSGKLGTQEVVEFFYAKTDTSENAKTQGPKLTYGGKQQLDYEIFANTVLEKVEMDGVEWLSREHFYQAQKFKKESPTYAAIQKGEGEFATAGKLRKTIKQEKYKDDLLTDRTGIVNFETLHKVNLAFFKQNEAACKLLLSTEKAPIIERNNHPDRWGITFRSGVVKYLDADKKPINRNQQGLILMLVREELSKG